MPVAIQVLVEAGLERLQRIVCPRHSADRSEMIVAAAVGVPDRVLIGARDLPGDLIPACRLLRADRRPGAKLTRHKSAPAYFSEGPEPPLS